jgi:hypothetical protein
MGVGVYLVGNLPLPGHWLALSIQMCLGFVLYVALCRLLRLPAFMKAWKLASSKMGVGPN